MTAFQALGGCEVPQSDSAESREGSFGAHGPADGAFVEPRALAVAQDGTVYVIDRTGRVQRFAASGKYDGSWLVPDTSREVGHPSGICVDQRGRVLVADTHRHRVLIFDSTGAEIARFGQRGTGPGQFMFPTDVVVDDGGQMYVAEFGGNDRVSKFSADGEFLLAFGGIDAGLAALQRPSGIAVDRNNDVLIADTENHRICRFRPDGTPAGDFGELGTGPGQLRYPRDVVVTAQGIVVADSGNNRTCLFDSTGHWLSSWGHGGRHAGGLHEPANLGVRDDRVFVADSRNHRVVWFAMAALSPAAGALATVSP